MSIMSAHIGQVRRVVEALTDGEPLTANQVARRTGFHWVTCANILKELQALGQAEARKVGAVTRYRLKAPPVRPEWKGGSLRVHKRLLSETVEVKRPGDDQIRVVR